MTRQELFRGFLAHYDLIATGPDTFTECDIRLLNFPDLHFNDALPLHASLHDLFELRKKGTNQVDALPSTEKLKANDQYRP